MVPAIWHLGKFSWDLAMPQFVLSGVNTCEFLGIENMILSGGAVAVILIPGRHSTGDYDRINECAAKFGKVVFCIYGCEEGIFRMDRLTHPNKVVWWFMPPFKRQYPDRPVINGWPSGACELIAQAGDLPRIYDVSFQGQNTHDRREQCVAELRRMAIAGALQPDGQRIMLLATAGFTQGVPREEYYRVMKQSKFVACPSGPCTVDSFRFAEALEAGCIPIADDKSHDPKWMLGYWNYVLGNEKLPFPVLSDWAEMPLIVQELLPNWETLSAMVAEWWKLRKHEWILRMREDLYAL